MYQSILHFYTNESRKLKKQLGKCCPVTWIPMTSPRKQLTVLLNVHKIISFFCKLLQKLGQLKILL